MMNKEKFEEYIKLCADFEQKAFELSKKQKDFENDENETQSDKTNTMAKIDLLKSTLNSLINDKLNLVREIIINMPKRRKNKLIPSLSIRNGRMFWKGHRREVFGIIRVKNAIISEIDAAKESLLNDNDLDLLNFILSFIYEEESKSQYIQEVATKVLDETQVITIEPFVYVTNRINDIDDGSRIEDKDRLSDSSFNRVDKIHIDFDKSSFEFYYKGEEERHIPSRVSEFLIDLHDDKIKEKGQIVINAYEKEIARVNTEIGQIKEKAKEIVTLIELKKTGDTN